MRTIKRYSLKINKTKWQQLCEIANLYRNEKNVHLKYFNQDKYYFSDKNERIRRDCLVNKKYRPETGLQARQWKTALTEAYLTVDKNWCALAVEIKSLISQHKNVWSDGEMHYAYWLTYSGKRLAELIAEKAPSPEHFEVTKEERKKVSNYIRRVVRRKRGLRSVASKSRSFELDTNMYSVFENNLRNGNQSQFIKIMSTIPRKMVVVPLTGYTKFSGTIKIILDFYKHRIEVHTTNELTPTENKFDTIIPLDAGISEVFMDELGTAYEPTFGKTVGKVSKQLNKTMKARNKSNALKKTSSKHKAHRIAKFNLGKNKLRDRKRKAQVRIKQQISHAIHQVVKERKPGIIVTERLDIRGKAKSKGMSRLVSYWMRGSLKERLDFLALAEGFCHKQVNPAYTSQMCPICLFVHKDNRKGDIFHCLNCGHTDHADRVAAINLLARYYDTEITVYTPKQAVLSILQRRFAAPLEKSNGLTEEVPVELTVSGRTDTDRLLCQSETPSSQINNGRGTEMSCLSAF